jgi:phosphatidylglycerophosphate synthase
MAVLPAAERERPHLVIVADSETALRELLGISFLERLLRTVQRLGFSHATILTTDPDLIRAHLAPRSWARADVEVRIVPQARPQPTIAALVQSLPPNSQRLVIASAGFYYDARLLAALADARTTILLVDSKPPHRALNGTDGCAALIERAWLEQQAADAAVFEQLSLGVAHCDAADVPSYIVNMRKDLRPVFFPAPPPELVLPAERILQDAAQKGTLDFPAAVFDPSIQDRIVRWLVHTRITPNQVSSFTAMLGLAVTTLFATGHLWWGFGLAYAVEVLDGVDGKLARTKVETTAAGDWEHVSDYFIELSWWLALAFHFHAAGLRSSYPLVILLVASNWIDGLSRQFVKRRIGRDIDDIANFDRFVRCIGARRNINIWILFGGLLLGDPANAFVLMCGWTAFTAAVHVTRAVQLQTRAA